MLSQQVEAAQRGMVISLQDWAVTAETDSDTERRIKKESQITPTPKELGLSTPRSQYSELERQGTALSHSACCQQA